MKKMTQLIKTEIKKQYKSVRQFSEKSGIPYSTLSNALSKGIGGTSYETIVKICDMLNLNQVDNKNSVVLNEGCCEICAMLSALDETAVQTVKKVLNAEHKRCTKNKKEVGHRGRLAAAQQCLNFEEALV